MLTGFQQRFTAGLSSKCVVKHSLKIPPHLEPIAFATVRYLVKVKCWETASNLKQMSCLTINSDVVSYSK